MTFLGVNIGGTTCSVALGTVAGQVLCREAFATPGRDECVARLRELAASMIRTDTVAVGISCGGPLDADVGIVLSPPNLPGWDRVPIVREVQQAVGKPTFLMNDANAGALAEWYFGPYGGCSPLVFLTCGTGMGAGILIDGKPFDGACGMAGEVGHIRLTDDGPLGFGKQGSFEGWCSGGGFAQYAGLSAKEAALLAEQGSSEHVGHFVEFGRRLGQALAMLIDVLNPQRVAIGGIYMRCEALIAPAMNEVLQRECLPRSLRACRIGPASSGERIGDHAALAVARYYAQADPLDQLMQRFPGLAACRSDIRSATDTICKAYRNGGKLLLCGNGGSMADCEHIAGELLKSFRRKRPLQELWAEHLHGSLGTQLEAALPAIPLGTFHAFTSAFSNDVDSAAAVAQQVHALGKPGDVLLAISTSGNARNIVAAAQVARAKGLTVIGLTGRGGGALVEHTDICIRVPADETYLVQEYHMPVYHAMCMMIEDEFFGDAGNG
jgi:glucokinase